jgi:hypothetical protein
MDFWSKGKITAERMVQSLFEQLSPQGGNINARLGATAAQVADPMQYMQQGPLNLTNFNSIYGTPDEFMARYTSFVEDYYATLDNRANHVRGTKVNIDLMKAQGRIDLGVLTAKESDRLYQDYLNRVLRLPDLLAEAGAPGVQMPSSNKFKGLFRYRATRQGFEDQAMHPAQVLLNKTYFGFNPRIMGLDSLSVGRNNIVGKRELTEIVEQSASGNILSSLKVGERVVTLDVETTGVFDFSNVRSFAAAESIVEEVTDAAGNKTTRLGAPRALLDKAFDSSQLAGTTISQRLSGGSVPMGQFLGQAEGTIGQALPEGSFLDESTDFINKYLLQPDTKLSGHNIYFDLQKMTNTMTRMHGFENHTNAQVAIKSLWEKVNQGGYIVDTLNSVQDYLMDEVETALAKNPATLNASEAYIRNLVSPELLARVQQGGSLSAFGMENISMTNLFELMERDGFGEELLEAVTKGSHVAGTDVMLQAHMANYVSTGELKIWANADPMEIDGKMQVQTKLGRFSRLKVLKSQAITPTTNIADVDHLSQTTLDYFTAQTPEGNRALQRVSLNLDNVSQVFQGEAGVENLSFGTLKYQDGKFRILTPDGDVAVNSDRARQVIRDTLHAAADPTNKSGELRAGKVTHRFNEALLSINDLGLSYDIESRVNQMRSIGAMPISTQVTG